MYKYSKRLPKNKILFLIGKETAIFAHIIPKIRMMKYFIRSVKYFIYLSVLIVIIMTLLVLINAIEPDIDTMFRNGYDALWQIAVLFAAVAAVYPKIGYVSRNVTTEGDWDGDRTVIKQFMESHYYSLEKAKPGLMTFRHNGSVSRLSRMYEDRITVTSTEGGINVEGLRKDVLRIASGLERTLLQNNG